MKIQLIAYGSNGIVSFLIGKLTYSYRWLDGPAMLEILRLCKGRKPGAALSIAKRRAEEIKKPGKDWEMNH